VILSGQVTRPTLKSDAENGKCLAPGDHGPHLQSSKDSRNLKKLWPPDFQAGNRISRKLVFEIL